MTESNETDVTLAGVGERIRSFDSLPLLIVTFGVSAFFVIIANHLHNTFWFFSMAAMSVLIVIIGLTVLVRSDNLEVQLTDDALIYKSWWQEIKVKKEDIIALELSYYRGLLDMYGISNHGKISDSPYIVVLVTQQGYVPLQAAVAKLEVATLQVEQIKSWRGRAIPAVLQGGNYESKTRKRPRRFGYGAGFLAFIIAGLFILQNFSSWPPYVIVADLVILAGYIILIVGVWKVYRDFAIQRSKVAAGSGVDYVEDFSTASYEQT